MWANKLTFHVLKEANVKRLPLFLNKGKRAHKKHDGSDWKLSQWSNAIAGETGELCNLVKKVERGDYELFEARDDLGKEIADIIIYASLIAFRCGIHDLGEVVVAKFNEVSDRVGCPIKISKDGKRVYEQKSKKMDNISSK